jgi:hypothetical protein
MKKYFSCLLFILFFSAAYAQHLSRDDYKKMRLQEDTLAPVAKQMIFDNFAQNRFGADSVFIKGLVKALKTPYSFDYPFDSIITVSKVYAPDSSFRIFTWQLQRDEAYYRQYGAIQIKTDDGSLKLYPLIDKSDEGTNLTNTTRTTLNWIGAIYYGIVMKEYKGKKFYTLFGFDDNDFLTTRKWLEVLWFDENNKPMFGGKFFNYKDDSLNIKPPQPAYRFLLEYKKDASAKLVYDKDMDMIVFDHLISESGEPQKKYTLIPDGDYEGFKWKDGKWLYVEKLFNQSLKDGQAPVPEKILDDNGSFPDLDKKPKKKNN